MRTVKLLTRCIRKSVTVCAAAVLTQCILLPVYAGPTGGNIVGGVGNIHQSNLTTSIHQSSQRLAIDWQTFNINSNESVNFNQPNRSSIALNRILDQNASQIHGSINANGQIVLVNPNGVFFGKNATVNAGGLFVAALDIKPEDFMQGKMDFKALENTSGLIVNEGRLEVIDGGALVLLGQQIKNQGLLVANFGTVGLLSGSDISVRFNDYEHFSIKINKRVLADILQLDDPAILNSGLIQAQGGNIVLTARQADAIKSSINNIDNQQAFSFSRGQVIEKDGVVYLAGPDGDISDLGNVDVSADNTAGVVVYSAENINHSGEINADVKTGTAGTVSFNANNTTLLTGDSRISAQAMQAGSGGQVYLLGKHVGLIDKASANASGVNGGGEVLLGGDYQGENPDIKNAEAVYLGLDTQIHADGIIDGDGGKIIVWSDKATRAYGGLSATGGVVAGNGGFIETSSHDYVDLMPVIDVSAVKGSNGSWLIDPSNITITNFSSSNLTNLPGGPDFTSNADTSNLNMTNLRDTLNTGANVVISTAVFTSCNPLPCTPVDQQPKPTGGNISLDVGLNLDLLNGADNNSAGLSSLTLNADHNILINADIIETGGDDYLNLTLNANFNSTPGGGQVYIANAVNLNLSAGNLVVTGNGFTNSGTISTENLANPGGEPAGDISINVLGIADLGNLTTDTDGGSLNVVAGSINSAGIVDIAGTTILNATGSIDISGASNDFTGAVEINGGTTVVLADVNNLNVNINSNSVTSIGTGVGTVGGNLTIVDTDITGTQLSVSNVTGNLNVTAQGDITDSGNLVVGGVTTLTVPDGSVVTLNSLGNNFTNDLNIIANTLSSLTVLDTSAFSLQDAMVVSGAINLTAASLQTSNFTLGNASILTLTSTDGNIDQNNTITHMGLTVLSATGGDINLNLANNLSNVQVNNATTANINNATNDINIISVAGTGQLNIDAQNITQLGNITATGADLTAVNTVALNSLNVTTLNVNASGGISETGVMTVTGTSTLDAGANNIVLNTSTHSLNDVQIVNASAVSIFENDDINVSGSMASLNVFAGLGVADSSISNVQDSVLTVSGSADLGFVSGGTLNLNNFTEPDLSIRPRNNLQGAINVSTILGTLADVSVRNAANIQLSSSNITNSLNLDSTAAISQAGVLRVAGNSTLQAASIDLSNASNNFNNTLVSNTATVNIRDVNDINITSVNNGAITVNAGGPVFIEGGMNSLSVSTTSGDISSGATQLTVSGNAVVNVAATSNVDFQTNQVNLGTLDITQANNVLIDEVDGISVTDANVNGLLDIIATDAVSVNGNIANLNIVTTNTITLSGSVGIVNAQTTAGDIRSGVAALTVIDTAILDAASSDIMLDNAANDIARINIVSAQDVRIIDVNTLQLMDVNSNSLRVETVGDITQTAGSVINVSGTSDLAASNGNVVLAEANLFNSLGLIVGGNANVVNAQALVLNDSSVVGDANISTTAGDLSINGINANSVTLSAADSLIDANANSMNIVAGTTSLNAVNGIGMQGANSAIDLQTANLSALNTTLGDINLLNSGGDITLNSIVNNATDTGNFNFESSNNVLIDNITLQQNLTEEFFPNGSGTVNMRTVNGGFLGVGNADINNPDITATNLRLIGVKGNLGTLQRPMVLDISGKVELLMRASLNPLYAPPAPDPNTDIQDNSVLRFTSADTLAAANGVQITEVETLLDIDPAIFTDIRHFVVDSDPVLLPRDQRFDVENEDEDEDDEYFRRIAGEDAEVLEN